MKKTENQKGFTLLEILLVVALIGILAAIAIVAINPGRQVDDTVTAAREADVNTISNAISQYVVDNAGNLPGGLDSEADNETICLDGKDPDGDPADECDVDLASDLVPTYLAALPVDPEVDDEDHIGYQVVSVSEEDSRVTVGNVFDTDITITR